MRAMAEKVRVGAGAGYAGDRWEPAAELAEKGEIDYLVFECLAERTIARESLARVNDPLAGYNPLLSERMNAVLPVCLGNGVRVITNMGAANPVEAGRRTYQIARELGFPEARIAVVLGDDVLETLKSMPHLRFTETGTPLEDVLPRVASANAYLGADSILSALRTGAEVIVTGRVADPSLFLAPTLYHLGQSYDDYSSIAAGTVAGHLLECAGQVTGGYFADPGCKDVEGLARLGFPYADISRDGVIEVGKVDGAGGRIDEQTCSEQLLYEMQDPSHYVTPDCVLDVTTVHFEETAIDRVRIVGAKAKERTDTYKVSVGYHDGFLGIGEISYAGINAVRRARLAGEIVKERLNLRGITYDELRVDLIGIESLHGHVMFGEEDPYEVRLRVAGRSPQKKTAEAVGLEVDTLYTNGPAGGAGTSQSVRELLAVQSVLLPRNLVKVSVHIECGTH